MNWKDINSNSDFENLKTLIIKADSVCDPKKRLQYYSDNKETIDRTALGLVHERQGCGSTNLQA